MTPIDDPRRVILCDAHGRPQGSAGILDAHRGDGLLHLAFSVYVFRVDRRSLLIQQRSRLKMLWPLFWANTCCSHPREGETPIEAGRRRLQEELGFSCDLTIGPEFVYQARDPGGRGSENEYDVILIGTHDRDPNPDPNEVSAWRWADLEQLQQEMTAHPEVFTPWLHIGLPKALASGVASAPRV